MEAFSTVSFHDPVFLSHLPGRLPALGSVLEYFALSPFYDNRCNNEVCVRNRKRRRREMQMQAGGAGASPPTTAMQELHTLYEELRGMTGVEYRALDPMVGDGGEAGEEEDGPRRMLHVAKYVRAGPDDDDETQLLELYYVLDGTIYQAPDVDTVLSMRLQRAAHYLRRAVLAMQDDVNYDAVSGHTWDSSPAGASEPAQAEAVNQQHLELQDIVDEIRHETVQRLRDQVKAQHTKTQPPQQQNQQQRPQRRQARQKSVAR